MARTRSAPVELGPYTYTVVPQKIGRIRRELNKAFDSEVGEEQAEALAEALSDEEGEEEEQRNEDMVAALGGQAHTVLSVFIPDLMPKYEWLGFASEEAMEADESDDATDHSPDMDQVVEAMQTCMKVNRIDLLKHLRALVGPDFLQAMVQKVIADFLTSSSPKSSSEPTADTTTTTLTTEPPTSDPPTVELTASEDDGYELIRSLEPIGASAD